MKYLVQRGIKELAPRRRRVRSPPTCGLFAFDGSPGSAMQSLPPSDATAFHITKSSHVHVRLTKCEMVIFPDQGVAFQT